MPRGRLIFPFLVELGLLDTAATAADPDGAGPLASGYDDEFREPVSLATSGSKPGVIHRVEVVQQFYAQIEDDVGDLVDMRASGNSPMNAIGLVFHYADLEAAGAVQMHSGKATIKAPGARLIAVRNPRTRQVIERYDSPPGYWATQAKSMGFGLGPFRNLLFVLFEDRATSIPAQES